MQTQTPSQESKVVPTRRITICGKVSDRFKGPSVLLPVLSLCGKWLQHSGFKVGYVVDIACELGKLTITLSNVQPHIDK